jgi:hypothetical protein
MPLEDAPLPPEVQALGSPEQVHRAKGSGAQMWVLAFGICCLLGSGGLMLAGFALPIQKPDAFKALGLIGVFVSMGFLAIPLFMGTPNTTSFLVFDRALVAVDGEGACQIYPWSEMQQYRKKSQILDFEYHVTLRDGRTFTVLPGITDYIDLAMLLIDRIKQHVVPRTLDEIAAGHVVEFPPFAVGQETIAFKGKTISWNQVSSLAIWVINGVPHVRIRQSGALFDFAYMGISDMPNGEVLLEVIRLTCPQRLLTTQN